MCIACTYELHAPFIACTSCKSCNALLRSAPGNVRRASAARGPRGVGSVSAPGEDASGPGHARLSSPAERPWPTAHGSQPPAPPHGAPSASDVRPHGREKGGPMRRSTWAWLAIGGLAVSVTGCGGDDDDAAGDVPELVIWADNSANTANAIEPLCLAWAEENGVRCRVVKFNGGGEINTQLTRGNDTGDVPDLFEGPHDQIGDLVRNGIIAPVDLGAKVDQLPTCGGRGRDVRRRRVRRAVGRREHRPPDQHRPVPGVPGHPGRGRGHGQGADRRRHDAGGARHRDADRLDRRRLPLVPAVHGRRRLRLRAERGRHVQRRRPRRRHPGQHRRRRAPAAADRRRRPRRLRQLRHRPRDVRQGASHRSSSPVRGRSPSSPRPSATR